MEKEVKKQALEIAGESRARWLWEGKQYTAQGVEVPLKVLKGDDLVISRKEELAPDDQVLDMKVTLPADALPPGRELVPIEKATQGKEKKEEPHKEAKDDKDEKDEEKDEHKGHHGLPSPAKKK